MAIKTKVINALIDARQKVHNGWCQNFWRNGKKVCAGQALIDATRYHKLFRDRPNLVHYRALETILYLVPANGLAWYNDATTTTKADIIALYDWAIGIEMAGGL